jgi:hypothetical protein
MAVAACGQEAMRSSGWCASIENQVVTSQSKFVSDDP